MVLNSRIRLAAVRLSVLATLLGVLALNTTIVLAELTAPPVKTTSADLISKTELLRDELELIRHELGLPAPNYLEIGVNGASAREVYSHVYTLSEKAHRLAFEFTGKPDHPLGILLSPDTTHDDTLIVLNDAMESIQQVKKILGIKQVSNPEIFEDETSSSTLLRSVILANRQINSLLYRGYSPTEVFHEINIAINFADGLLRNAPKRRPPQQAASSDNKTASDVYVQLIDIFNELTLAARNSGLRPMRLRARAAPEHLITASDVYDISRVLISELAFMYSLVNDPGSIEDPSYPDERKHPSQLHEHAEELRGKVRRIIYYSAKNPEWLARNSGR